MNWITGLGREVFQLWFCLVKSLAQSCERVNFDQNLSIKTLKLFRSGDKYEERDGKNLLEYHKILYHTFAL